ncbi:MAG: FAD-dependent oxidoreductase [Thermofilaceae archaeon]|nr:FAD-dependent oxidoreductase [Thermofilaceae archaeon]MDW8004111.1 FAD-dependent oxidoreductase [Thermofilaceae archaeon]
MPSNPRVLKNVERALNRYKGYNISFEVRDGIVYLYGRVKSYDEWVDVGLRVGKVKGVEGVVNKIVWEGFPWDKVRDREVRRRRVYEENVNRVIGRYDVVVIGGGVTGTAIARELTKFQVTVALVEKAPDVAVGATKANNGMIHAGVEPPRNTLKRKLNVKGCLMYERWAEELGFSFKRIGSLWLITPRTLASFKKFIPEPFYKVVLKYLLPYAIVLKGRLNSVKGLRVVRGRKIFEMEPNAVKDALAAVYVPWTAIVDPYEVAIALAENALENGAVIYTNAEVVGFIKEGDRIKGVVTSRGTLLCRYVVNAAGVYADEIAEMAGSPEYTIHPRKGVILLFHKSTGPLVKHCLAEIILPMHPRTKGGGINPTVHGNVMWGPTATETEDKEDTSVDKEDIEILLNKYSTILESFPVEKLIRYFAGVRAATFTEDFVIRPAKWVSNLLHVAGIQSPGLASAPAIAEYAVERLREMGLELRERPDFNPRRKPLRTIRDAGLEEIDQLVKVDSRWGNVVCGCEMVTELEVVEAIRRGAKTLDAIKRRTRAGMGECQGSRCILRLAEILSRELGVTFSELLKEEGELFDGFVRGESP